MRISPRRLTQFVALGLVLLAILAILLIPTYGSATGDSGGAVTTSAATVLAVNGPGALVVLAIPLVIALAPVVVSGAAARAVSIASAVLLTAFSLISLLSVGGFFLPAAIAEIIAVLLPDRARGDRA